MIGLWNFYQIVWAKYRLPCRHVESRDPLFRATVFVEYYKPQLLSSIESFCRGDLTLTDRNYTRLDPLRGKTPLFRPMLVSRPVYCAG